MRAYEFGDVSCPRATFAEALGYAKAALPGPPKTSRQRGADPPKTGSDTPLPPYPLIPSWLPSAPFQMDLFGKHNEMASPVLRPGVLIVL